MNISIHISILLIFSILALVKARNASTNKITSVLKTRATILKLCNNTIQADKDYTKRCDIAVASAIYSVNSTCNLFFKLSKLAPIEDERCEEALSDSMSSFKSCKAFLGGARFACLCASNKECCMFTANTLIASVESYCEIFSSNVKNNTKEICNNTKQCESINNLEAKKARKSCYDTFGINVPEDSVPFKIL
ncbi:hypothetical protein ACQ4LE_004818 [Meloidogyne hapla]|uniref:DUF19 domain-containing protein n=1 Tax=Meloidogyne hapla TaxID=6305 RepID=A0A1I8B5F8_MELHA